MDSSFVHIIFLFLDDLNYFFMIIPVFQVDAFTSQLFGGNPAAVCPLDEWLPDTLMQQIAAENNLAETAFIVEEAEGYRIRWFTPAVEVDLCGHATLASAHVFFNHLAYSGNKIEFNSRSGKLIVTKTGPQLTLDFPADEINKVDPPQVLAEVFGSAIQEVWKGKTDYMVVFNSQLDIEKLNPDFRLLKTLEARGVIVTASGDNSDLVSRFFAPQSGIDEDPVTGSAHTTLTVYWSKRLNKENLTAIQLSERQGSLSCKMNGNRIEISGESRTFMVGEIYLNEN
jgi:PhzF family phenazine biosynthesis protein